MLVLLQKRCKVKIINIVYQPHLPLMIILYVEQFMTPKIYNKKQFQEDVCLWKYEKYDIGM